MNSKVLLRSALFISAVICSFNFRPSLSMDWFSTCGTSRFSCGNIVDVDYPFWGSERPGQCGYPQLKLNCEDNITTIDIVNVKYHVLDLNQSAQILKIVRFDLLNGICSPEFGNTILVSNIFEYAQSSYDVTIFYDCPKKSSDFSDRYFTCPSGSVYKDGYVLLEPQTEIGICNNSVIVAVPDESYNKAVGNWSILERALTEGLEVKYKVESASCNECTTFCGACGYDWNSTEMVCYRRNQSSHVLSACLSTPAVLLPPNKTGSSLKRTWTIGISATLSGIIVIAVLIICFFKREQISNRLARAYWWKGGRNKFDVEAFIRNNQLFAPRRYNYSQLKKMTNSFAEKIGKGGFGMVYKGKLADGRLVAVKVLSELNGNGEEFINEVVSIGRTCHVNIVSLLGFCYEKTKRALIYDFMPNGSLDRFIFDKGSLDANPRLEWRVLYDIAVGVARGLEYLHRGCKSRILHFDIKPQNILLDKDFCPKISDFGLAKLWLRDESIMSMMGARGTAGYIAPEVFSRSYGGVSHKSDVYSYGMLVLEMVGGRKNFESAASNTSETCYSYWIYKDLEADENTSVLGISSDEEREISKKMILVSLWCIQTKPADRPSMTEVVEMMGGSIESIEIPPKPFLFSPGKTQDHANENTAIPTV